MMCYEFLQAAGICTPTDLVSFSPLVRLHPVFPQTGTGTQYSKCYTRMKIQTVVKFAM